MKRGINQIKEGSKATPIKTLSQKQSEAKQRSEIRAKLGDKGQLAKLNQLNLTAKKERAKLSERLSRKGK